LIIRSVKSWKSKAVILLTAFVLLCSTSIYAQEDCVFDDNAYIKFINSYSLENTNSEIMADGRTLIVTRNNDVINVEGGGCDHLGVGIQLKTNQTFTEEEFLRKTLALAIEFGDWLINTDKLKKSIKRDDFQIIDGIYYFEVDAMTVFDASYGNQGKINVDFYIN